MGGLLSGFIIGSWVLPLVAAIARDGLGGVASIPSRWGFAGAPSWMERRTGEGLKLAGGALGLGLSAILAIKAGKLSHHLIVHKIKWMTEEDVRRYNGRPRAM